jgi:hypothetical protein
VSAGEVRADPCAGESCQRLSVEALRLDPEGPGDLKLAPSLGRVLEQGGLADAGFALHHQHAAASTAQFGPSMTDDVARVTD